MRDLSCGDMRILLELEVRRIDCRSCGKVKQERLDFLANNPFYTKRFAYFVGRRCRQASISDVAKELALDWHTVKALEMQYTKALARAGTPGPLASGSTRLRSARVIPIGSWSAIFCGVDRSGLAARTDRKPAWRSSTPGLARRARVFALL